MSGIISQRKKMDFDRPGRTKQIKKRKKGKLIQAVTNHNYDYNSDDAKSDTSRFSRGEHNRDRFDSNREEKRRTNVKEQLEQSQCEKHARWQAEQVQDLTGDETPQRSRTFDGVSLDSNEKTRKMKAQLSRQDITMEDVQGSIGRNGSKAQTKRRGKTHQTSSLSTLDQRNRRILAGDRKGGHHNGRHDIIDPLDEAMALQNDNHATASEFRNRNNFTSAVGRSADQIFSNNNQRFGHENPKRGYGKKNNGGSMVCNRRRQKETVKVQRQDHPMTTIPKKQKPQQDVIHVDSEETKAVDNFNSSSFMDFNTSNLDEINNFNNDTTSPVESTGKRKQRETKYDEVEVEGTTSTRLWRANPKSRVGLGANAVDDDDMMEVDSDTKKSDAQDTPSDDEINATMEFVSHADVWDHQSFVKTPKESSGRSNVHINNYTYDFDFQQSALESETKLKLTKVNNNNSTKKKKKGVLSSQ